MKTLRKAKAWLDAHLSRILLLLAFLSLTILLAWDYLEAENKLSNQQLILVGLILATAVLAQFGNDLLPMLKKVGPVEFMDRQSHQLERELKGFGKFVDDLPSERSPSPQLLLDYQKADRYVTFLEHSGRVKEKVTDERLFHLLFNISRVALQLGDWARVVDRLDLLRRVSNGEFKPAETRYRCGLAHLEWARASDEEKDGESHFDLAQSQFLEAVRLAPNYWEAYFNLAYVQVDLKMYEKARQNNLKALEIRKELAPAKYNLAICHVKLSKLTHRDRDRDYHLDKALKRLTSILPNDLAAERTIIEARKDEELKDLLRDEKRGPQAYKFLYDFGR